MATPHDAEIVLKLYDLRRETVMREARKFVAFEFAPKTYEEFAAVVGASASQESAYFRQVASYWEMAAGIALRGGCDQDLYMDSNGEGIFIFTKLRAFHAEYAQKMGMPFMPNTAQLIATVERAGKAHQRIIGMLESRGQ